MTTFEKPLTANPDVSGVSGDAVGETPSNPANGLGVDGGTPWHAVKSASGKIKLVIKRRPPPPPLDPFVCVVCETEVERDPYHPDHQNPPVCHYCEWRGQGRLQSRQLPFRHWTNFRRAYVLLAALDKEITRARHAN